MDWIFDHLRLIIIVGGAIAYWLNQRQKAKQGEEASRTNAPAKPVAQVDDEAERIRRIQEEIRRKIQERMGGVARSKPSQVTQPAVKAVPPPIQRQQPKTDVYAETQMAAEQQVMADQAVLEQQQLLALKLRELQEQRREHDRPAEVFAEKTAQAMAASGTAVRGSLLADLRTPTAIRRAVVLREVLGTPVGLR